MTPLVAWTLALLALPTALVAPPAADELDAILAHKLLRKARVAVAVADPATGELLVARRVDAPMIPASNLKLITSAAAIDGLGPEYHFETRLLASEPPRRGELPGDLVVVGSGDPCLRADVLEYLGVSDPAAHLAGMIAERGIERIQGALVLDDGRFDREWVHPDWEAGDLDDAYAAPISALSIHGNCLSLVADGRGGGPRPRVRLGFPIDGYTLDNRLEWSSPRSAPSVGGLGPDDAGRLTVLGTVGRGVGPVAAIQVPVRDAPQLFGRALQSALGDLGIEVREGIARDAGAGATLEGAVEIASFRTHISLAVMLCNKESDNSAADHLLKALGAQVVGEGSFAGGSRAVTRFLADGVGTPTEPLRLSDGSGLARSNRVTARTLIDTLSAMNRADSASRDLFLRSLPVAGLDGTLDTRLEERPYRGAVRAKSGFIQGVSALSGYLVARSGRVLAFSILFNDAPKGVNSQLKAVQDDICRHLIDRF